MSRYRVTIASLMAVMIPVALGLVALREATQFWVDIVFNLVVASLLLSSGPARRSAHGALPERIGRASRRSAGHVVLGLISMPWGPRYGVSPNLATLMIVERFWAYSDSDTSAAAIQGLMARFLVVQSLFSLLLGLIGAKTFCFFARRGDPTESSGPSLPAAPLPSAPR